MICFNLWDCRFLITDRHFHNLLRSLVFNQLHIYMHTLDTFGDFSVEIAVGICLEFKKPFTFTLSVDYSFNFVTISFCSSSNLISLPKNVIACKSLMLIHCVGRWQIFFHSYRWKSVRTANLSWINALNHLKQMNKRISRLKKRSVQSNSVLFTIFLFYFGFFGTQSIHP